jgi:O-6-methylguanine DNA methyltransferase
VSSDRTPGSPGLQGAGRRARPPPGSRSVSHVPGPRGVFARHELDEYFAGRRQGFDVALDWTLTKAFRREVLRATAAIPYGETSSYRRVATAAGSPNAVRAAGSALANNPIPILVPCHRVLRTDGGLGQYRGGAAAKERLLALETAREEERASGETRS